MSDQRPADIPHSALSRVFRFTPADLTHNRQGRLSDWQRQNLGHEVSEA